MDLATFFFRLRKGKLSRRSRICIIMIFAADSTNSQRLHILPFSSICPYGLENSQLWCSYSTIIDKREFLNDFFFFPFFVSFIYLFQGFGRFGRQIARRRPGPSRPSRSSRLASGRPTSLTSSRPGLSYGEESKSFRINPVFQFYVKTKSVILILFNLFIFRRNYTLGTLVLSKMHLN